MNRFIKVTALLLCALMTSVHAYASRGEQKQVFGEYEVHYIGLTSDFLTEDVAKAYGIDRSRSLAFFSFSVIKKDPRAEIGEPVAATLTGTIRNLIGQSRPLEFREIKSGGGVYYISTLRYDDREMYNVLVDVKPEGSTRTFNVKFSQKFYNK